MKRYYFISVLFFMFSLLINIPATEAGLTGDLNEDNMVGYDDVWIFSAQWLSSGGCSEPNCADLYVDDFVDFLDFSILSQNWKKKIHPLVINEFMAANSTASGITDPQGDSDDWIEIHNYGGIAIDISGMYITDDISNPLEGYHIPDDVPEETNIPSGGYLLIWADDDISDSPGLHADFQLDKDGEEIGLFDTDGTTLIDMITFAEQTTDISFGREPDANDNLVTLLPTPGTSNNDSYIGVVEDTKFSIDRGFYESPLDVAITCQTEGATIRYTLDFSEPNETNGSTYSTPINISTTSCLRARAFKPGYKSSNIDTHSYIFIDDVITQSPDGQAPGPDWPAPNNTGSGQKIDYGMDPDIVYDPQYSELIDYALLDIPTISIVTDLDNLFDSETGIYVNALQEGFDWERTASVELMNPDGSEGFQVNSGLRIRGGWSRHDGCPKHSFRLFFRSKYGDAKLKFPLFGEEGADKFDKIDLRTAQNYSWSYKGSSKNTFMRDVFSRDSQRRMGQPYTKSRFYHLYINGQYWGLYQTQERSDAHYAATYFGGDGSDYDVIKADGGPTGTKKAVATDGNLDAYTQLWNLANQLDDESPENKAVLYQRIQGRNPDHTFNPDYDVLVDVDNLIDYMICTFYVGDRDGPISDFLGNDKLHNFYCIYNRVQPDGFKFFRHDAEHSLDQGYTDRTGPYTVIDEKNNANYFNPQTLHQWLAECPEYRIRFADRVFKHFFNNSCFTQSTAVSSVTSRANEIDLAIIAESARWGDAKYHPPRTKHDDWLPAVDDVLNFFNGRTETVLNQFKNKAWYPDINPPDFYIDSLYQHGGYITPPAALTMSALAGTIYYTIDGNDPYIPPTSIDSLTIVPEDVAKVVLIPTATYPSGTTWRTDPEYNDTGWDDYNYIGGRTGGVGYENSEGYEDFISYDVESSMDDENTSCYIRIPFTVTSQDLSDYDEMTLKIRFDDGFVAYINGTEVARANFAGTPQWDSNADDIHDDSVAVNFQSFTADIETLNVGSNILAIHGLNAGLDSSDFLNSAEMVLETTIGSGVSGSAVEYTGGDIILNETTQVKARAVDSGEWSALNEAVYAAGTVKDELRITEIMYHPKDINDPNAEFIELVNIGAGTINLNQVQFTDGIDFTFPSYQLAPDEYAVLVHNIDDFEDEYGTGINIAGEYTGRLDNAGENIRVLDANNAVIQEFDYEDDWYPITDGQGFSLTFSDANDPNLERWDTKEYWHPGSILGGTPGTYDSGTGYSVDDIVINELLAHSHGSDPDLIELHNTTGQTINIGGWFLSDDSQNLKKYEIETGTSISGGSYIVFEEDDTFGSGEAATPFALSENGETLYLSSGWDGELTGYSEEEEFGASDTGVSFGRYVTSTGRIDFVSMSSITAGGENTTGPRVGPIVITEIMYHPQGNSDAEFVEIYNKTATGVDLFDIEGNPWKFTDGGGIDYLFPAEANIPAYSYAVLVKDSAAFESEGYTSVPGGVQIFEWGGGKLDNGGEDVIIAMPGDLDGGIRQYITIDHIEYDDQTPWPVEPDTTGDSLNRINNNNYGNDVANWQSATPSPGQ